MRKRWRPIVVAVTVLMAAGTTWGAGFSLGFKAGYFAPKDDVFKDVYKGGPVFGGELAVSVIENLDVWAGADFFSKKGQLTFTEEETKIRIVPLYAGLRYRITPSAVCPYVAAAVGLFLYKEENVIGTIDGSAVGFLGQAGILIKVANAVAFDLQVRYSLCKDTVVTPDEEIDADIGGFQAGAGIVIRF